MKGLNESGAATRDKVIIALDEPVFGAARETVESLGGDAVFYKVGAGLFAAAGWRVIEYLKENGKKVFLDLKFHDIPNSVAAAGRAVVVLGVDMFTVHLSGGAAMVAACRRAVDAAADAAGAPPPAMLGVTVLTSVGERTLREETLCDVPIPRLVVHYAELGRSAGADGVVASPLEAALVRKYHPEDFMIVTPGVRPAWAARNDQERTLSPAEAFARGATHIVVGRPVTTAPDPSAALKKLFGEIAGGRGERTP
ncbi:MAG: orotidine-5'-phosphate decarboxylase [bacterium]